MNCQEAQDRIVLYEELSSLERDRVDQHLASCSACSQVLMNRQNERELLRRVSIKSLDAKEEGLQVDRIMSEILIEAHSTHSVRLLSFDWIRYAAAVLCIVLSGLFLYEQSYPERLTVRTDTPPQIAAVIPLNTSELLESLKGNKEKAQGKEKLRRLCIELCSANTEPNICSACDKRFK